MNDTRCAIDINQLISTSLQLIANSCCSLNNWFIPKCGSITMQVRADQRKILETKEEQIEALEARNEALERTNADFLQRPEGVRCVIGVLNGGLMADHPIYPPKMGSALPLWVFITCRRSWWVDRFVDPRLQDLEAAFRQDGCLSACPGMFFPK